MSQIVLINNHAIEAINLKVWTVEKNDHALRRISFDFKVTHQDYHDVTTLLYKNDFVIEVPSITLKIQVTITNYSTSITNLYQENAEGDFTLELTEKV